MSHSPDFKTSAYKAAILAGHKTALEAQDAVRFPTHETAVVCPCCGDGTYLHHYEISVFERKEDAEICRQTTITARVTSVAETDGRGNPSYRRNGFIVKMSCENCGSISLLSWVQHKGQTLISHECIEGDPGTEGGAE